MHSKSYYALAKKNKSCPRKAERKIKREGARHKGKTFINKLGTLLRVFRGSKKREFGKDKDDFINITSESGFITFESSCHQDSGNTNRNLFLKKSKSVESIATGTISNGLSSVNELKRSHGTCDILSGNKEEEVKCTKSLNRLCQLNHANNCVFSYHVKLHDSTIWSRALGRVAERPKSQKNECTSSSTIDVEQEESFSKDKFCSDRTKNEEGITNFQETKIDKSTDAKTDYMKMGKKLPENVLNPHKNNEESERKVSVSSNTGTFEDWNRKSQITSPLKVGFSKKNNVQELLAPVTQTNRTIYDVLEELEPHSDFPISIYQKNESEYTESSKITFEEQNLQVKMDLTTIKNEEGFGLMKYDVKSSGDHVADPRTFLEDFVRSTNSTDVVVDQTSYDSEEPKEIITDSSKAFSDNTTEYEVVNLGQIDLFKEFKTTISKMRNVLNVLEEKKSLKGDNEHKLCEPEVKKSSAEVFEAENIWTQTAAMPLNQISTSTDSGSCNQTKNEGIMVELSSETTNKCKSNSKHITLDKNLFNYMKPRKTTRRRRRRGYRCKCNRFTRKALNNVSSSQDGQLKMKMKPGKPHYNKCVVYHITQQKNAMDRCVGPSCPSMKEKLILQNTFSALHFGPIHEFPVLLNKREHENEKKKKKEGEQKLKSIASQKGQTENTLHRTKSTSFLSSEVSNSSNQDSFYKSKMQPSLKCESSKNYSSFSTSTTTANWFVFKPSPPLVMEKRQSTSDELLFDTNRSSTQELVSNILEEEFKTSGLKGRISSSTMNLIKDQFMDKLSGMKHKDIPNVTITVCVPLKNIVSKIKTSKKKRCQDKAVSISNSTDKSIRRPSSSAYDKSIQVNVPKNYVNDNLQTIPEKMGRKSAEIYQHNKLLRESMSSKRLSTFKKLFGNKATSCSNINPFGHLAPKTSRIYFSDHSTSSPDFPSIPVVRETVRYAHKKILTTPKTSSVSLFKEDVRPSTKNKRESFFLNLPPNRYRKKREQISKLFDGSDSSDRQYFGEPKLLYHVHESSFYSTSKTDDKLSSRRIFLETSVSNEESKMTHIPIQQVSSRLDIKVKPKYISFCNLPRKCDSEVQALDMRLETPTKDNEHLKVTGRSNLKNADVNTSNVKLIQDNETQCETERGVLTQTQNEKKSNRKKIKTIGDNFFDNSIDEFSVVSLPKVHFEDEINNEPCKKFTNTSTQNDSAEKYDMKGTQVENNKIKFNCDPPRKDVSVLSLFAEDNERLEKKRDYIIGQEIEKTETIKDVKLENSKQKQREIIHRKSKVVLQTSSDSNLIHMNKEESGIQLENTGTIAALPKRRKSRSKDIVKMESTQVDSITSLPKKENFNQNQTVQVEVPKETKNDSRLTVLIRDVVNLCNSSFVKSRDCIVELTLYNLIKEIIMEHCSHLSEQSRQKIESILANFIKISKQKAENQDIGIVESAIENLVKEIGPNDVSVNDPEEKIEEALRLSDGDDLSEEHEVKQRRKHSRSKSKHRGHKHRSKHRSRMRKVEEEHREKHYHRGEERKHRTKRHHKHYCDNDGKCDVSREDSQTKFRTVDGKREYTELVQRLKELEEVTKQLSNVAQNQQNHCPQLENHDYYRRHKNWYTECLFTRPKYSSKKKKFSLTELEKDAKEFQQEPVKVNYFQTKLEQTISSPIPKKCPKLPVTKIVINLSNLKLLARNCVSLMSTSVRDPIVITDSTEEKQKLINEIVSYEIKNECRSKIRHSSRQLGKFRKNYIKGTRSEVINRNKESFTITVHGKDKRKIKNIKEDKIKLSKNKKDYMRIKMIKKKKTVTSKTDQNTSDSYSSKRKNIDLDESNDIHRITKEYIKKEYMLNSDYLCSDVAKNLLENRCNIDQVLDSRGNLNQAYQRMANFCLFRGLLKKD